MNQTKSKRYGYVRVSTKEQNEDRQLLAMQQVGIPMDRIFIDKQSGKDFDRPAYQKLLRVLKEGDLLLVKSIDRLGRDYEEIIEQWQREGIDAAQARGVRFGRPGVKISPEVEHTILEYMQKKLPLQEALRQSGLSQGTFMEKRDEIYQMRVDFKQYACYHAEWGENFFNPLNKRIKKQGN